MYMCLYVYFHQEEDNLIDFFLQINNSATLGKTTFFQFYGLKYFEIEFFTKSIFPLIH